MFGYPLINLGNNVMTTLSQFDAIAQFIWTRDRQILKRLDTSWRGFFRTILIAFVVSLLLSFVTEWLEEDPELRFLDYPNGWLVITLGEVISVAAGLIIWYLLSRFFGWIRLYRQIVVYLNWLVIILTPPLLALSLLAHHTLIWVVGERVTEDLPTLLIFALITLVPMLYYSVLSLWRGCELSLRISLLTVLLFTCLDLIIRYKVLILSWYYLQSGASLS